MIRTVLASLASILTLPLTAAAASGASPDLRDVAGAYYEGDGLGLNWKLHVSADGRFTFTWDGCLGRYDENSGEVALDGAILTLRPEHPLDQGVGKPLPLRWLSVSWGERRYLVEEDDAARFAQAVNQGTEPRSEAHGTFLLREDDWRRKVDGAPALPDEWSALLLPGPVDARVIALLEGGRAEIDRGSRHGLRPGMLLTARGTDLWFDVTVRTVHDDRSVVEPEEGATLTARHRVSSRLLP